MTKKKIVVLGAGHMGAWLVESLCLDYEVGVYDPDRNKLKYFFHTHKFLHYDEIRTFAPDILINAVSLHKTKGVFDEILPYLPKTCILSDITSVKNGIADYYRQKGFRFVSTHPMFGPTFANIRELEGQNAIIIQESDEEGKEFFRKFYGTFKINIFEYTFEEHDQTIAYSLSIPFASTMVFAACMKKQEAPGTTFKKHMNIAKGLFSEDDYLLAEIMFNRYSLEQVEQISSKLNYLIEILRQRDMAGLSDFLNCLRENIR